MRRKDQIGERVLAGLVDAKAGLHRVGTSEQQRLAIYRLQMRSGVGAKADADSDPFGTSLAHLDFQRCVSGGGRIQIDGCYHARKKWRFLQ